MRLIALIVLVALAGGTGAGVAWGQGPLALPGAASPGPAGPPASGPAPSGGPPASGSPAPSGAAAPAGPAEGAGDATGQNGSAEPRSQSPFGPIAPVPVPSPGPYVADTPTNQTLYRNGPDGRFLMGGAWLFRYDQGQGTSQHFERSVSSAGWSQVFVPNAWNAQDESAASFSGTVAWYRKDFKLPSAEAGLAWLVRFESVNYRTRAWLNGHPIGSHAGAYLAFELRLADRYLNRGGVNRLVVRVDDRRKATDFPPGGVSDTGKVAGGWWNYGGLLREVYLRRVNRVDFDTVSVLPQLPCPTCAATIRYRVTVRNYEAATEHVHLTGHYGSEAVDLGSATVASRATHTFSRRLHVAHPHLWSTTDPHLYDATLDLDAGHGGASTRVGHYFLMSGVRSIAVSASGLLVLNGQVLNFRGVGLHEDSRQFGFAVDNTIRQHYVSEVKALGATAIRAHYPLHPELEELADENGILLWSEIPVYSVKTVYLARASVRRAAVDLLRRNIATNANHPSVIVWSIGNELSARPGSAQSAYISQAVSAAHSADPTRPVGLAVAAYPSVGCQTHAYKPLQVLGLNDYFGWYPGPEGQIADRSLLSGYLDLMHRCYAGKSLIVTEYGAEANRPGPVEERGTYAFQQDYLDYNLNVFASKPWLGGAIYWALEEFRVRPNWDGGNPRPDPPIHEKGLIDYIGRSKPAFFDAQRRFRATPQVRPR